MFSSMCKVHHCINYLLPDVKTSDYSLRKRDHITILNYFLGTTVYWGTHLSFAVFSNSSEHFLVVNCCNVFLSMYVCYVLINIHTYIHTYIHHMWLLYTNSFYGYIQSQIRISGYVIWMLIYRPTVFTCCMHHQPCVWWLSSSCCVIFWTDNFNSMICYNL